MRLSQYAVLAKLGTKLLRIETASTKPSYLMNTFAWLIVGHLVGDWMLQNDWMARNKQNSLITLAGMTHFAVYTICIVLFVLFTVSPLPPTINLLTFTAILFITHWLIDATNLAYFWGKVVQQSDILMVRIVVDQSLHIIVLAFLIEFLL